MRVVAGALWAAASGGKPTPLLKAHFANLLRATLLPKLDLVPSRLREEAIGSKRKPRPPKYTRNVKKRDRRSESWCMRARAGMPCFKKESMAL